LLPRTILNRVEEDCSIKELIGLHEAFVASNSANSPDMMDKSSTSLRSDFEAEMRELLEHFVAKGILTQDNKQMIRYSVRGMFYIWAQFLREFVKFS